MRLGNHQQPGVDFVESFSPVARIVTFRVLVALFTKLGLVMYQGDVETAYLNANNVKIKQYVQTIPGFPQPKGTHLPRRQGAQWIASVWSRIE